MQPDWTSREVLAVYGVIRGRFAVPSELAERPPVSRSSFTTYASAGFGSASSERCSLLDFPENRPTASATIHVLFGGATRIIRISSGVAHGSRCRP